MPVASLPQIVPPELEEFLSRHDDGVRQLALAVRAVVHDEVAPCHEYIFAMKSKVVLLYGVTERVISDGVCSISVLTRHVTLMFTEGAALDDPAGLLRGKGKLMRHIRIETQSDVARRALRAYLRQARQLAACGQPTSALRGVVTKIKASKKPARAD